MFICFTIIHITVTLPPPTSSIPQIPSADTHRFFLWSSWSLSQIRRCYLFESGFTRVRVQRFQINFPKKGEEKTESIEWFIEDQTFMSPYDLPPPTPNSPLSPISKLNRRHTGRLRKRDNLLTGGGSGRRDSEKALSSIKSFNTLWGERSTGTPKRFVPQMDSLLGYPLGGGGGGEGWRPS